MEKQKIGISTIYDPNPNFGNRLQNYAVQTILEKMGFDVVTYSFEEDGFNEITLFKYLIHKATCFKFAKDKKYWTNLIPSRIYKFRDFNKKYIKTKAISSIQDIDKRDFYVLGSDQVWNVNWYGNNELRKNMYMLTFAKPYQKICIAPSFGVNELPKEWLSWFNANLNTFKSLSVREDAGAKIIKDLVGAEVPVLIDPTMMLTKEDWRKMSVKPNDVKNDYILTYFLSEKGMEAKHKVEELKNNYNLYEISNSKTNLLKNIGPAEFVWLFDNAKLILTDSFHACVFAFLFDKPFIVYDRNWNESNTNSRITTLLSKFDLERKYINSNLQNDIWENDFSKGKIKLEKERHKMYEYLKNAFEESMTV